ncbi:S41 family peptidase [Fodinibius halophilus]|uniref:Tail specific protease domain-containing protein n=1 Tax=Fodinibius halophilus TaxID=1736908 RepID=A0A6M1SZV0_9BACT|nr:S41 family peptidase [Fodinibius halophilus]NGP89388.1 hypothetical protein [Fodinibius halophilus]
MPFNRSTFVYLLVLTSFLWGCKTTNPAPEIVPSQTFSADALRQDLNFTSRTIQEVHPAFYNQPEIVTSFQQQIDSLKNTMDHRLNRQEFFLKLAPEITAIQDGHTTVGLPWKEVNYYLKNNGRIFPFDIIFGEDGTYVYRNYSKKDQIKAGLKIRSINETPVKEIKTKFTAMFAGKNKAWRLRRMEKQSDFFKALLWINYQWVDTFDIVFSHDGQSYQETVMGISRSALRSQRDSTAHPPFNFTPVDEKTGLLTINYFGEDKKKYDRFLTSSFEQINRSDIDNLIIDIRDNAGGNSDQAEELLSYLADAPFLLETSVAPRASSQFKKKMKQRIPGLVRWLPLQYFDKRGRTIWRAEEGSLVEVEDTPIQPKAPSKRFKGKLYVLINEGTFSTATTFASAVKRKKLGTLIGRETGGEGGTFYAHPLSFQLPNTKLSLRVSSMKFQLGPDSEGDESIGVLPDSTIPQNIGNEIRQIDTILQECKIHIKKLARVVPEVRYPHN